MRNMEDFAKGITEMAEKCPFSGNVSATFDFHAGNVCGISVTPEELDSKGCKEDIKVFTPTVIQIKNGGYDFADFLVSERVSLGQAQALVRSERNRRAA